MISLIQQIYLRCSRSLPQVSKSSILLLLALPLALAACTGGSSQVELLNVSFDPTREFYEDVNRLFTTHWGQLTGESVVVRQSHGGSGKQGRSVIDGLEADVVTLALSYDIDAIARQAQLLATNWQQRLPNNSSPFTSTIVFAVRKGNPKQIKDWRDLAKANLSIITPNPKTSGGARWNYLAAYGYALQSSGGNHSAARDFLRNVYGNVPVMDTGARGATVTFLQRGMGDVLIAWESEALLAQAEAGETQVEIVYPSVTLLAELPVALVDRNVQRRGTAKAAAEYLNFLYSDEVQRVAAKYHFRPSSERVLQEFSAKFPEMKLLKVDQDFGGWAKVHHEHFRDGGIFDEIYRPGNKSAGSRWGRE